MSHIIYITVVSILSLCWGSCEKNISHPEEDENNNDDNNIAFYYNVGFSKKSLEPSSYPFSLSLAGYAAPPDGRFTMEWMSLKKLDGCVAFSGANDKLICIKNNELMLAGSSNDFTWTSIGVVENIRLITGNNHQVFGIDDHGNLHKAGMHQPLTWTFLDRLDNIVAISAGNKKLYVAKQDGSILYTSISENDLLWQNFPGLSGVKSLASYEEDLYALTAYGDIHKINAESENGSWLKISRHHSFSNSVALNEIAIASGILYGLNVNSNLLQARHKSDNNLFVTSLAIGVDGETVVLVGVDVCGFDKEFIREVKDQVYSNHSLPHSAVLINASHTHFAPVTQNWLTWREFNQRPDNYYMDHVIKPAIMQSISEAINDMSPSELHFGRRKTSIGANRSLPGAVPPHDNDLDVLKVIDTSKNNHSVLFLAGCHPVHHNSGEESFTISANFPGVARNYINNTLDFTNSMFLQGCGGDINPVDANHRRTGETLAKEVLMVTDKTMRRLQGKITHHLDSVNISINVWSHAQIMAFREQFVHQYGNVSAEKNVRWADLMFQLISENRLPEAMPVYIQTINIGEWKLIGLSREVVAEYGIGIKQLWPDKIVSVAGFSNDVSSYLPSQRHVELRTYEGYDSFFWYGQPSTFPATVYDQVLNTIKNSEH